MREWSDRFPARTRRSPRRMRTAASHACECLWHDSDFVAEPVARCQRQRVATPKHAWVEPVVVLIRRQQSHLLVGDGDRFRAIGRFQSDLKFLLLSALSSVANPAVYERNSPR